MSPHQLVSADTTVGTATAPATTRQYSYDPAGNLTKRTIASGGVTGTTSLTYGPSGDVDTASVSSTSTSAAAGSSKYVRDADGNVLLRIDTSGSSTTTTLYLPGEEVSVTASGSTLSSPKQTRYYSFGGVTVAMRINNNSHRYVLGDLNGTSQVLTNPGDWSVVRRYFDPFGNQLGSTLPAGSSFLGARTFLDKPANVLTQMVDVGARLYDWT